MSIKYIFQFEICDIYVISIKAMNERVWFSFTVDGCNDRVCKKIHLIKWEDDTSEYHL